MRPALEVAGVTYVTTLPGLAEQYDLENAYLVPDCNRDAPWDALKCCVHLVILLVRIRPKMVISTGALPGVIALALGRLVGAKTIWVDSVANAEEMSQSGRIAKRFAHIWLSQWEHVAHAEGAQFEGAIF